MKRTIMPAVGMLAILILAFFGYQFTGKITDLNRNAKTSLPKLTVRPIDKTGSAGSIANLKMDIEKPNLPEKVMVYKVRKPIITKDQVLIQANNLGISGEVKESLVDFSIKSQNGDYIVDKETGSFHYITDDFKFRAEPLKTILSDEEYKKLATDFLTEKGLMKAKAVFRDVNKGNVTLANVNDDGNGKEVPFMIEVRFSRDLNGMEWNGVGPKISVYFGENGKITGAASVWREVEPYQEYPIISLDDALAQIKEGNAQIFNATPNDTVAVKEVKLIYISDPIGYHQEFVIPYYLVRGTNNANNSVTALTRAIPENLLSIIPPPPYTAPRGVKTKK